MKVVGTVFLSIGVLMLALTIVLFEAEREFLQRALHTTGTVVQLVEHRTRKGSRSWTPRVAFRDAKGEQRIFEGSVGNFPAANRVGDTVPVVYDSSKADVDSAASRWLLVGVLSGIGAVFTVIGFFVRRTG